MSSRKHHKALLVSAAVLAAALAAAPALAKDKGPRPEPELGQLTVTGTGEYEVMPDEVVLNFSISSQAAKAADARAEAEKTVTAFLNSLQKLKLPEGAVTAQSLSVSPRYSYKDGESLFRDYQASRDIRVTLDDFALISEVTDLAFDSGINSVPGFQYQLKDEKAAEKQARALAMADAKAKAEELAAGFDVKLGHPRSLSFGGSRGAVYPRAMLMSAAMDSSAGSNSAVYTADKIKVQAEVTAVYTFSR